MDDHIAYALVLVALPWPAQPTWRLGRAYHRTVIVRRYRRCAALTATRGRTGQVS
jgi:hypothetical protein